VTLPSFLKLPEKIGWRDQVVGLVLALVYVVWLLATARSVGFPRDEGVYFHAGGDYGRWMQLLLDDPARAADKNVIAQYWSFNDEHPALMKSLFGISYLVFYEKLHLFSDASTAFRLPAMCMAGMSLWVTYLFGARVYSRRAGIVAAVSLALMPHVFFHAHLACFDVPITAMWTLCIYIYWRSFRKGWLWAVLAGVVFGLTLETKHNAWILPGVFLPHAAIRGSVERFRQASATQPYRKKA